MELKQVRDWFLGYIKDHPNASNELKRSLFAKGSMLNAYIQTLHKELNKCESTLQLKKGKSLKTETYKEFVKDMAHAFVTAIEKKATENMQSDLKKLAVEKEKNKEKEYSELFSGNTDNELGEYVNDGVLVLDESILGRSNKTLEGV